MLQRCVEERKSFNCDRFPRRTLVSKCRPAKFITAQGKGARLRHASIRTREKIHLIAVVAQLSFDPWLLSSLGKHLISELGSDVIGCRGVAEFEDISTLFSPIHHATHIPF